MAEDTKQTHTEPDNKKTTKRPQPNKCSVKEHKSTTRKSAKSYQHRGSAQNPKQTNIPDKPASNDIDSQAMKKQTEPNPNRHPPANTPNGNKPVSQNITQDIKERNNPITMRKKNKRDADQSQYTSTRIYRNKRIIKPPDKHCTKWKKSWHQNTTKDKMAEVQNDIQLEKHQETKAQLKAKNKLADPQRKQTATKRTSGQDGKKRRTKKNATEKSDKKQRRDRTANKNHTQKTELCSKRKPNNQNENKEGITTFKKKTDNRRTRNNRGMKVKSVCKHNDNETLGTVIQNDERKHRIQKSKKKEQNHIKMSKNQKAPQGYEKCQKTRSHDMKNATDKWNSPKNNTIQGRNKPKPTGNNTCKLQEKEINHKVTDIKTRQSKQPRRIMGTTNNKINQTNKPQTHQT
ncbi:hypothetical protein [Bacteroides graminisolvens]|uniref:hypothetical protein n=1 Tax=Bacteroides graminisolvens TaxID=477666 RepID=UPI0003F6AA75|nr:hypothetical protein [Bacteroides graminisolvens]